LEKQGLKDWLRELHGDTDQRDQAYNACSKALVAASDVLIAIYDKKNYSGVGTAYTIQCAAVKGIPVIHIPNSEGPARMVYTDKTGARATEQYSQQRLLAVLQEFTFVGLQN